MVRAFNPSLGSLRRGFGGHRSRRFRFSARDRAARLLMNWYQGRSRRLGVVRWPGLAKAQTWQIVHLVLWRRPALQGARSHRFDGYGPEFFSSGTRIYLDE